MKIAVVIRDDPTGIVASTLNVVIDSAEQFGLYYRFEYLDSLNTDADLKRRAGSGEFWGAFALNKDASSHFMNALLHSNNASVCDPTSACSYWYDQGRSGSSYQYSIGTIGNSLVSFTKLF